MLKKLKKILGNAGCPACGIPSQGIFTSISKDTLKDMFKEFRKTIRPINLEYSKSTFECKKCHTYWHLSNSLLSRVPLDRSDFYLNWIRYGKWDFEYQEIFETIGGISSSEGCLGFPCCVTRKNNDLVEKSIILFTDFPPFYAGFKDIFLLSDIQNITLSKYMLPKEVRYKSHKAPEKRMCYAPTYVETLDGIKIIFNYGVNFLDIDGIDSSRIKLSEDKNDYKALGYSERVDQITIFVGKYDESLEKYRLNFD